MINSRRLLAIAALSGIVLELPRRIADEFEVVTIPPGGEMPPGAPEKLDAERRELEQREEVRRRERARMNFLPHGGEREARRRRRHIERGQLKAENGLAR